MCRPDDFPPYEQAVTGRSDRQDGEVSKPSSAKAHSGPTLVADVAVTSARRPTKTEESAPEERQASTNPSAPNGA